MNIASRVCGFGPRNPAHGSSGILFCRPSGRVRSLPVRRQPAHLFRHRFGKQPEHHSGADVQVGLHRNQELVLYGGGRQRALGGVAHYGNLDGPGPQPGAGGAADITFLGQREQPDLPVWLFGPAGLQHDLLHGDADQHELPGRLGLLRLLPPALQRGLSVGGQRKRLGRVGGLGRWRHAGEQPVQPESAQFVRRGLREHADPYIWL
jgi:hypothetical protein